MGSKKAASTPTCAHQDTKTIYGRNSAGQAGSEHVICRDCGHYVSSRTI